jgi:hypothetical protein
VQKVHYTKTEIYCVLGKPECDLHRSKYVVLRIVCCCFYNYDIYIQ